MAARRRLAADAVEKRTQCGQKWGAMFIFDSNGIPEWDGPGVYLTDLCCVVGNGGTFGPHVRRGSNNADNMRTPAYTLWKHASRSLSISTSSVKMPGYERRASTDRTQTGCRPATDRQRGGGGAAAWGD